MTDNNIQNDIIIENNSSNIQETNDISLKVISMDEKIFIVPTNLNFTIKEFKEKLQTESNVPWDKQRLIYKGKLLENSKSLKDYNFSNMDAVHFIAKLSNTEENTNNNESNENNDIIRERRNFRIFDTSPGNLEDNILFGGLPVNLFSISNRNRVRERDVLNNGTNGENNIESIYACLLQNNIQIEELLINDNIRKNYKYIKLSNIEMDQNNLSNNISNNNEFLPGSQHSNNNLTYRRENLSSVYNIYSNYSNRLQNKINFIDFNNRSFTIGQWVDVKDTVEHWLEAEIIDIKIDPNLTVLI